MRFFFVGSFTFITIFCQLEANHAIASCPSAIRFIRPIPCRHPYATAEEFLETAWENLFKNGIKGLESRTCETLYQYIFAHLDRLQSLVPDIDLSETLLELEMGYNQMLMHKTATEQQMPKESEEILEQAIESFFVRII